MFSLITVIKLINIIANNYCITLFSSDYFNTVYVKTWLLNLTTLCEQNEAGKQIAAPQSGFEPTARANTREPWQTLTYTRTYTHCS